MVTEPLPELHPLLMPNPKNAQTLLALIYQELVALRKDLNATKETRALYIPHTVPPIYTTEPGTISVLAPVDNPPQRVDVGVVPRNRGRPPSQRGGKK